MKKYLAILTVLCLFLGLAGMVSAFAEGAPADDSAVTAEELAEWAAGLKARALETTPENDPADESADVEGGILFMYPFATIYADRAEMTADTHLNAITLSEEGESAFRDIALNMTPGDLIALFPNDNPDQAGTREGAFLFLRETDNGALRYGRVYRDGQRVSAVQYGDLAPAEGGYYLATLTCVFSESLLYEIQAEGFDPATAPLLTQEDRDELARELNALSGQTEYRAVRTSRNGTDLTPFGPEDLVFSGLDFLSLQPADLPGTPESEVFDNEDGSSLIRVDGDGYVAVFRSAGNVTEIVSLSIEGDETEGPRGVRLGDAFHEDLQRFRDEAGGEGGTTEVLYGAADTVPRGVMENGMDGLTLRYVTAADDGRTVELLLRYTLSRLSEIIIHIL